MYVICMYVCANHKPTRLHCSLQIGGLVDLVRGKLSKVGRMVLSALIVVEVHARDVVAKMCEEKVQNSNDFEWISQLRWVMDGEYTFFCIAVFLLGFVVYIV